MAFNKNKQSEKLKTLGEVPVLKPRTLHNSSGAFSLESIMHRGYFPLWRKIVDWGWYKEGNTVRVFIHLLLKTNREKKDYMGHEILPGQCVTGRKNLSQELGLSEQQIRTALRHLKATNEVTIMSTPKFSVITLNNYFKYLPKNYRKQEKSTSEITINQPATNQQLTTTNKDKKEDKDKDKERRRFTPPSLLQVKDYVRKGNYGVDPDFFYKFFNESGWVDSRGNKVKNWKQKIITWDKHKKPETDDSGLPKDSFRYHKLR